MCNISTALVSIILTSNQLQPLGQPALLAPVMRKFQMWLVTMLSNAKPQSLQRCKPSRLIEQPIQLWVL